MIWSPKPGFTPTFPGVPSEMKAMWNATAAPWLLQHGGSTGAFSSRVLRFTGVGESTLAEQVTDLLDNDNPTVAPYASLGDVTLRLTARADTASQAEDLALIRWSRSCADGQARPVTAGMRTASPALSWGCCGIPVKRWPSPSPAPEVPWGPPSLQCQGHPTASRGE